VLAFALGSNGNVPPVSPPPPTGLAIPSAIARDPVSGNIYIANQCNSTVTVYAADASGIPAPIATIGGTNTGLSQPTGIALDSNDYIYVTNPANSQVSGSTDSVTIYAPSATGNVAPVATIAGTSTMLSSPSGVAVDTSGTIYVANTVNNSITEYAPLSNGNVAPVRQIRGFSTELIGPVALALDSNGDLYVSNNASITVYPAGTSGNATPSQTIIDAIKGVVTTRLYSPQGLAVDSSGNIFVAVSSAIHEFAAGSTGTGPPTAQFSDSVEDNITAAVALDSSGNIIVANSTNQITVFPPGSNGQVVPTTRIGTGLDYPTGIALDSAANTWVGEMFCSPRGTQSCLETVTATQLLIYPAGSNADLPLFSTFGDYAVAGLALDYTNNPYISKPFGDIDCFVNTAYCYSNLPYLPKMIVVDATGLAVDANLDLYAAEGSSGVVIFVPTSSSGINLQTTNYALWIALDSQDNMYVSESKNMIEVYAAGSSGTTPPIATISGSNTGLNNPQGIAVDSQGNIYVANNSGASITEYAAGSNGNVSPIATISGSNTGLTIPYALAIGP